MGREAEGKQTILLPSASLQSSQRARLEILKEGRRPGRKGTGARNETSRGDLPLVPGSALEEVTFQQIKPLKNEKESDLQEGCRDQARL